MKKIMIFTLVELLVVVAVISILMSILLPAMSKARDRARTIVCANNQKQTGNAVAFYMNDFDQYFYSPDAVGGGYMQWGVMLLKQNYLTNGDLLCCPSAKGYETYDKTNSGWFIYGAVYSVETATWSPHFPAISMKKYNTNPSNTMLFGCSYSIQMKAPHFRLYAKDDITENYGRPYLIHNGFANGAFLDGHIDACGQGRYGSILYPIIKFACSKNKIYIPVQ
jgi:prepilin-type N-terminal cleavage/methylation domain-containing protein/prepilin-type processing-associated H-X9-DG protein